MNENKEFMHQVGEKGHYCFLTVAGYFPIKHIFWFNYQTKRVFTEAPVNFHYFLLFYDNFLW